MVKLYTIEELKDILKLSAFTIRKKIREKEIIGHKVGRNYLVREDDLKRYIDDLTEGSNSNYNDDAISKKGKNGSANFDRQNRF